MAVNGIPIGNLEELRRLETRLTSGSEVRYRVDRGGKLVEVPLRLASPLRSPYILIKTVVSLFVALIFVGVAVFVLLRSSDDRRALVFYAFALVSAMALLGAAATVYETAGGRGIVPTFGLGNARPLLFFFFTIAYAPLILHLALIFPRERPIVARHPFLIRWIYAERCWWRSWSWSSGWCWSSTSRTRSRPEGHREVRVSHRASGSLVAGWV